MANTFKFGNGNWAVKDGYALAYNDENNNFKPLPFDFTRASSATTLNRQGLIETVGSGKPRIDFLDNTDGHLLLEPSRTNLAQRSEEFDNSYWLKSLTSITANQAISPDGTQTADTITKNADFGALYKSGISISSGSNYTLSIFVKKSTTNFFSLRQASGSYDVRKQFNLTTKEVSNGTGGNQTGFVSSEIKEYANDWLKISIVCTSNGTSLTIGFYSGKVGESTNNGDSFIWGAQLEAGSYATSYIPTEGSSVTRVAETANGAGSSTVFNDSEGVLFAEITALANDSTNRIISVSDGSGNNRVLIKYDNSSNTIEASLTDGGLDQASLSHSYTITNTAKIAFKYKANDFALWVNGSEVDTDSNGTTPSGLDTLNFDNGSGGSDFYGKVKDLKVYNTALTDTELQNLTS